jgi:lipopolysaccharide biosynthesis glycosyltransferase
MKVFVGTDSDIHQDAERVLEYSIRKNTAEDVDLTFMRPGWKSAPTGFSTHRYLIPSLCNWEGYAIYLDVDMLVLGDLRELMDYAIPGKWAITGNCRDEVAVIDCSVGRDFLPTEEQLKTSEGKRLARQALLDNDVYANIVPKQWNVESIHELPNPKLIHYTNTHTQPWHPSPIIDYMPYDCPETAELFFVYLEEAA